MCPAGEHVARNLHTKHIGRYGRIAHYNYWLARLDGGCIREHGDRLGSGWGIHLPQRHVHLFRDGNAASAVPLRGLGERNIEYGFALNGGMELAGLQSAAEAAGGALGSRSEE